VFTSLVILFLSPNVFSLPASPLTRLASQCACSSHKKDKLEEPLAFAFGKFEGQCIDSCRFRRARLLKRTSSQLEVGNVLHLGDFYSATIPLKSISTVEIGFEEFAFGVYHVFLRFGLNKPAAVLRSQTDTNKPTVHTDRLVLSAEGVPAKGRPYSLLEAFMDQYLFAIRLTTGQEMERWITDLKHPVTFYPLKVTGEQARHAFSRGVEDSDAKGMNTGYRLFTNNCSTAALSLIIEETGFAVDPGFLNWNKFEMALPIKAPIGTFRALTERKLVNRVSN
jgi:hypothetical protein